MKSLVIVGLSQISKLLLKLWRKLWLYVSNLQPWIKPTSTIRKRLHSRFSICGTALAFWQVSVLPYKPHTIYLDLASSNLTCPKALSSDPSCTYVIQQNWLTLCASIRCNFISSLWILNNCISFSRNNDLELASTITNIQDCLSNLDKCMSFNNLKRNKDKTEPLYLYSKHCPIQSLPTLSFRNVTIHPSIPCKKHRCHF